MSEKQIKALMQDGDDKVEAGEYERALELYREAVKLVPEPFVDQEISTEIIAAIGDAYYYLGEYEKAEKAFKDVMLCPGAPASPYIRLRRGQIAFELNDMKKAMTELACAYMNGGAEVFEDEDKKYFDLITPIVQKGK